MVKHILIAGLFLLGLSDLWALEKERGLPFNLNESELFFNHAKKRIQIYKEKNYLETVGSDLKKRYSNTKDRIYIQKLEATAVPPPNLKVIATAKSTIVITADGINSIELSFFNPSHSSLLINGRDFKFEETETLESNHKRLIYLLQNTKKAYIWDLIIPKTYANPLAKYALKLTYSVIAYYVMHYIMSDISDFTLNKQLDPIREACENRDSKIPYEQSKAFELLSRQEASEKNSTTKFPELELHSDCSEWSQKVIKSISDESLGRFSPSKELAESWCRRIKILNKCMGDYKKGVLPTHTTPPSNQSDGSRVPNQQ